MTSNIYHNESFCNKLVQYFRPNFNVRKHLEIAEDYLIGGMTYAQLAKKYHYDVSRICRMMKAYKTKILPVIQILQKEIK